MVKVINPMNQQQLDFIKFLRSCRHTDHSNKEFYLKDNNDDTYYCSKCDKNITKDELFERMKKNIFAVNSNMKYDFADVDIHIRCYYKIKEKKC